MKSEKGISLSITAIVIIAVGLVVMLVVLGYFVGGFGRTGGAMSEATTGAEKEGGEAIETGLGDVGGLWKKSTGKPCRFGEECTSGTCTDGLCT